MTPQPMQITSIRIPCEYADNHCLYPIIVDGNTFWCSLLRDHFGDHFVKGPYFKITWRSGLIV